jgi:ATP-dependent helicase/nuclease subunit B
MRMSGPRLRASAISWKNSKFGNMTDTGPHSVLAPEPGLIETAAHAIVEQHRAQLPNLALLTILLPNQRAAAAMEAALRAAAGVPVLLLPVLTTLQRLAATVPLVIEPVPDSRRAAMVYEALREREWFSGADLWHVTGELLALFDDLGRCNVGLPDSFDKFVEQLERAYQARAGVSMQFEARLVHELWYALHASLDKRPDILTHYHLRLSQVATHAVSPLYAIGLADLSPAEESFFSAWAQRQPVTLFQRQGGVVQPDTRTALLETAWLQTPDASNLKERAQAFHGQFLVSPLAGSLSLFGATSLEEEARAVDVTVRLWLLAGKKSIAIVALDRLAARRARALLERAEVLLEDETGWTFSTVAASTVVMRWLDAVSGKFYYQDLLDLLKSPFMLADWPASKLKNAVYELEQLVRAHSVVSHLPHYLRLAQAEGGSENLLTLLQRLKDGSATFATGRRTLAGWLSALQESLNILGVIEGLKKDAAGEQLLALFARLQAELEGEAAVFSLAEWRQWLNRQLESATFRDESIASPIVLTHLAATRLRNFDAVLLLGSDAAHLPAHGRDGAFFNQSVRAQLGLPNTENSLCQEREDLIGLIARCPEVLVTWQAVKNAESNLISPYFERLEAFNRIAYAADLRDQELAHLLPQAQVSPELSDIIPAQPAAPTLPPHPSLLAELVPQTISASGYNSLMACPYQYFARHALKLNEPDEVQLELEKKDFGTYVHKILKRFHERFPKITGADRALLEQTLSKLTEQVFAEAIEANYLSHAWALRWQANIPAYLDWQLEWEEKGWCWQAGEVRKALEISLNDSRMLTLKGTLDRVDGSSEGRVAILDYKTQDKAVLKKKLERPGEDVQLPVYALLLGEPVAEAAFVGIDRGKAEMVPFAGDLEAGGRQALERLHAMFDAIYRGAPLPAQGVGEICGWCEMRGLCRRDYWSDLA